MKNFETNAYTMNVHDDLLIEFKVKKNVKLQAADIWESREQSVNYMPGKKFYVLFETDDNFDVSVDARRAGASEEYSKHVAAVALCSNRLHEKIIGNLFLKINNPIVPTRFFDDRQKAIEWLKERAKA
ncbi:MAG: STAS/SEC14 domain-containing protein [Bacteroidia bacterium]